MVQVSLELTFIWYFHFFSCCNVIYDGYLLNYASVISLTYILTKGQLILKCLFGVFNSLNIASGSEANMTTLCEMEFFNFLWLIWVHYLPLPSTKKDRPPRPP